VAEVDTPPTRHDVFLSFSGDDRHRVAELADALAKAGVRPFVDDREIRFAHSITGEIQDALRTSKTMLLYYSASFPQRSACQFELRHAYLSALRAGEVSQRILVVNPEDPDTDHLMPLELRSHRYWKTWNSKRELAALVARIRTAVDGVDTPFPAIDFSSRATVHSRPTEPIADFVGRYRDRWMIHSALHRGDYPLTETVTSQPVAGLTGMTGMGRRRWPRSTSTTSGSSTPATCTGPTSPARAPRPTRSGRRTRHACWNWPSRSAPRCRAGLDARCSSGGTATWRRRTVPSCGWSTTCRGRCRWTCWPNSSPRPRACTRC
jgi:TIR domain-containing protein